jgi:hypothetical protein
MCTSMVDPQTLKEYIMHNLGIESFPEDIQNDIIEKLGQVIAQRITLKTLARIPSDVHDTFDRLVETADEAEVRAFIEEHISDYDMFVKNIVTTEIETYKKLVAKTSL